MEVSGSYSIDSDAVRGSGNRLEGLNDELDKVVKGLDDIINDMNKCTGEIAEALKEQFVPIFKSLQMQVRVMEGFASTVLFTAKNSEDTSASILGSIRKGVK